MSIEARIEALTAAVVQLTQIMSTAGHAAPAPVQVMPQTAAQAPMPAMVAPPPVQAPAAPAMPAPPMFAVPAPAAPVAAGAPFTDGKGLIEYVMGAYKSMGPLKGAQIQGVLGSLGYQNINDVKPDHYAALYAGVEALKAS